MKLFKKSKKGFTLVELVVVIAVIAILAAVSVGAYFGVTESAKNSQAQQEGKAVHTNIVLIANDPEQDDIATFSSTGLTIKNPGEFEKALESAVGSVDYQITGIDSYTSEDKESDGKYDAVLNFTKDGGVYTKFTYKLAESDHSATFVIVTGAQE